MVPACIECHEPHEVRRVYYDEGMSDPECLSCHGKTDLMSAQVHAVGHRDSVSAVSRRMVELRIHRVLVTDEAGEHIGLITAFDVLRAIGDGE